MKVRVRFSKLGKIRFTSHRDVARMWERALRRASLPVAYTEGFSPRPKLSFGLALSTGHESLGEYLDVDLATEQPLDLDEITSRLTRELPVGLDAQLAACIAPGTPSLQEAVTSCTWRIEAIGATEHRLCSLVEAAVAAEQLPVTRARKGHTATDDVRPGILSVAVTGPTPHGVELSAELATHPRSVRPSELVLALDPTGSDLAEGRVCRTHQWMQLDGARREPLPLPEHATSAPHAEARAS